MIITSVLEFMEDSGIGTINSDLFLGELPFDRTDILSLIYVLSPAPDKAIPYYRQVIEVWAQFTSYETGMNKMQQVFNLFHKRENYEIADFHVYLSFAMGMVDDMDRDSQRKHLFRLSLTFVYRNL